MTILERKDFITPSSNDKKEQSRPSISNKGNSMVDFPPETLIETIQQLFLI